MEHMPRVRHLRGLGALVVLLCTLLPLVAACGGGTAANQLPSGWTTYRDSHYAFTLPIAPGWKVSPITNTLSTGAVCDYMVRVFPPDFKGDKNGESSPTSEQVFVRVILGCGTWPPGGHDDSFTTESKSITISGTQATMYDGIAGWQERAATTQFGGHEYVFGLQSPPEHAQRDLAIYMQMLQDFKYTGK